MEKEPKFKKAEGREGKEERVLNPEEIEELGDEMGQYVVGLKEKIDEIKEELRIRVDDERAKELKAELEELEQEYEGLKDFADAIEAGDFEEITEKDYKGEE